MQIYVNNRLAALKQGTSFEYVSENRMFSGSDGYTLTITFPLKDCPECLAIFGHINRADVAVMISSTSLRMVRCRHFNVV
jgi:hypothetical protein